MTAIGPWWKALLGSLELGWTEVLLGFGVFLLASVGGLALTSVLLVRLPATYFADLYSRDFWVDRHPVLRWAGLIAKNLLGLFVVAVGVVLAMPGVPGPGFLTILIGVSLVDFPGKRRLERRLIRRPRILAAVNRLRERYDRPPFVLDEAAKSRNESKKSSVGH